MQRITLLFFLFTSSALAQDGDYRFQTSLSLHTLINYGTRSFSGVSRLNPQYYAYEFERYDIDYKNSTASLGFAWKFGWNWARNDDFMIRQTIGVFGEIYEEEITFTLIESFGETGEIPQPLGIDPLSIEVGYSNVAVLNGVGYGFQSELLYLHAIGNDWFCGGGFNFTRRYRGDKLGPHDQYIPNFQSLTSWGYLTQQLGLAFQIEKNEDRVAYFLNVTQAILTLKKKSNMGAKYFDEGETINPISHNMDFRFPLSIQFGATYQFGKIKK